MTNVSGTFGTQASDSGDGWSQARPVHAGTAPSPRPVPNTQPPSGRVPGSRMNGDAGPAPSGARPSPRVVVPPPESPHRPVNRSALEANHVVDPTNGSRWDLPTAAPAPQRTPAATARPTREPVAEPAYERGLPAWAALLVLLAIAGVGGLIDMINGTHVRGGFNIGIIVASVVAIIAVRRSAMFPIVVAPPIVYSAASGFLLYIRSGGLHDRKVLIDTAANWLVYGFPAIAAATAAVLIIAGIRIMLRR